MPPSERATCWSLTINNPTPGDEECLNLALQKGWRILGQLEKGEKDGTPHWQMMLSTPQVRFSAVKLAFPRAHIEIARKPAALATYVAKEDTRVGNLPTSQEMYPSQARFYELVWDRIDADPTASEYYRGPRGTGRLHYPTNALNRAAGELIAAGYHVENIASNPMTIRSWDLWHVQFAARKTLRQTDMPALESDATVPTVVT